MEGVHFYKKPRLKNPWLIAAWPGMGEVAIRAAMFLINQLKAEEFAEIPAQDFFFLTGSSVHEGILTLPELPFSKFYFWKNPSAKRGISAKTAGVQEGASDLIFFVSDAQPDLAKAEEYCRRIIHVAKMYNVQKIVTFAAMPQPIDHTAQANVWLAGTHTEVVSELVKKHSFQLLSEGQISGLNGLFLGIAKKEGFRGFCLLGETPFYTIQIENPRASAAVLDGLSKIVPVPVNLTELIEQSHNLEEQINKLLDFLKLGPPSAPTPIGEEEIEKIKKSLSQLTRLPVSVQEKIEKLFQDAKSDISKARQLKEELDKWNVYRDYEDRFLDLFKKTKDKSKDQNN
jgi:predicted ATP-grasp superfamily ATP-dependent carboligase